MRVSRTQVVRREGATCRKNYRGRTRSLGMRGSRQRIGQLWGTLDGTRCTSIVRQQCRTGATARSAKVREGRTGRSITTHSRMVSARTSRRWTTTAVVVTTTLIRPMIQSVAVPPTALAVAVGLATRPWAVGVPAGQGTTRAAEPAGLRVGRRADLREVRPEEVATSAVILGAARVAAPAILGRVPEVGADRMTTTVRRSTRIRRA